MLVAGPPAVGLVGAGRQHDAEHAVFHVEHRHVLVDDDFEQIDTCVPRQVDELFPVQSYDAVTRPHPVVQVGDVSSLAALSE